METWWSYLRTRLTDWWITFFKVSVKNTYCNAVILTGFNLI